MNDISGTNDLADRSLLIVDSEKPFVARFVREMEQRGYKVSSADTAKAGLAAIENSPPAYAVVDLKLGDGNGLELIAALSKRRPGAKGVVVTGYANIATAVAALKLGATDYLTKPTEIDEIERAFRADGSILIAPPENPMSPDRVRWEHIQRVYEQCNRNVSETARRLTMHRRTLQRILAKRAPR
ncbi:MAG: DNA-binding response regulator [Alphaproteobacteria bacterium]|jgi:two-component system response regulator RegA|nr:ActR/PrrA/RegA family redox response regulator transcription factor [Beijerinckiaceae bacterium]NBQ39448.1 DNA-binding response regulator [Alphaproteobacteria bacterium]